MLLAILFSIFSGITIVISRTTNALLAQKTSNLVSTYYNYAIGLCFSLLALFLFAKDEPSYFSIPNYPSIYYYLGGPLGIIVVFLSAYLAPKISSIIMTLLLFFGQISLAIIIDWILCGYLDISNIIGGLFVFLGLLFLNQKDK